MIDLAPGAEGNELALLLARAIEASVAASVGARADFRAMRGGVLVVAQDAAMATTLRFDHGRLTIHDGHIGVPIITLCGDLEVVRRLPEVPLSRLLRLPFDTPRSAGGKLLFDIARRTALGELRFYGALSNPRLWLRFVRIVAGLPRAGESRGGVEA